MFNQLYITNKMERFSFKSERAMQVVELLKEEWSIVGLCDNNDKTIIIDIKSQYLNIIAITIMADNISILSQCSLAWSDLFFSAGVIACSTRMIKN